MYCFCPVFLSDRHVVCQEFLENIDSISRNPQFYSWFYLRMSNSRIVGFLQSSPTIPILKIIRIVCRLSGVLHVKSLDLKQYKYIAAFLVLQLQN